MQKLTKLLRFNQKINWIEGISFGPKSPNEQVAKVLHVPWTFVPEPADMVIAKIE